MTENSVNPLRPSESLSLRLDLWYFLRLGTPSSVCYKECDSRFEQTIFTTTNALHALKRRILTTTNAIHALRQRIFTTTNAIHALKQRIFTTTNAIHALRRRILTTTKAIHALRRRILTTTQAMSAVRRRIFRREILRRSAVRRLGGFPSPMATSAGNVSQCGQHLKENPAARQSSSELFGCEIRLMSAAAERRPCSEAGS